MSRDVEHLPSLLPHGHVVAVDGSSQMLSKLRGRLANNLDRVTVVQADLRQPLHLGRTVDAALSVAALHWLPDHTVVFRSVAAALRPGGQFIAEWGTVTATRGDPRGLSPPGDEHRGEGGVVRCSQA